MLRTIIKMSDYEPDITDRTYHINALISNRFNPKDYARCNIQVSLDIQKPELELTDVDMVVKHDKDKVIIAFNIGLRHNKLKDSITNGYLIVEDVLYFISNADTNPKLRLYVPNHIRQAVLQQFHDLYRHYGLDRTYETMKARYFWPNQYKEVYHYVESCVTSQERNMTKIKPTLQETDITPCTFAYVNIRGLNCQKSRILFEILGNWGWDSGVDCTAHCLWDNQI